MYHDEISNIYRYKHSPCKYMLKYEQNKGNFATLLNLPYALNIDNY